MIANCKGPRIDTATSDAYFAMVGGIHAKHYTTATRYTTSAFMRMKLGASLPMRNAAAHVFKTRAEAMAFSERQAGSEAVRSR